MPRYHVQLHLFQAPPAIMMLGSQRLNKPTLKATQPPPKTSAVMLQKHSRQNLTLRDWLTVVAYHDSISQEEVIKYFANKAEGALILSQPGLERFFSYFPQ